MLVDSHWIDGIDDASIVPRDVADSIYKIVPTIVWLLVDSNDIKSRQFKGHEGTVWLVMKSWRRLIVKKEFPCKEAARIYLDVVLADSKYAIFDVAWCKRFCRPLYRCAVHKIFEHVTGLSWEDWLKS